MESACSQPQHHKPVQRSIKAVLQLAVLQSFTEFLSSVCEEIALFFSKDAICMLCGWHIAACPNRLKNCFAMVLSHFLQILHQCVLNYICGSTRPRLSRTFLYLSKPKGGLGLPNFTKYYQAANLAQLCDMRDTIMGGIIACRLWSFNCNQPIMAPPRWPQVSTEPYNLSLLSYMGQTLN